MSLKPNRTNITRRLRGIRNAWHFQFESVLVFTAQWVKLGGLRCSPLNAALAVSVTREYFDSASSFYKRV